ncbi:MAG TPA: type IV pilus biogenesis/stability protein PilW, partial [Cellvibrionaceae bacterium]
MTVASLVRRLSVVFLCVALGACVSTRTDTANVDEKRALESHISLALNYIESKNRESARHHLRRAFEIDRRSVDATFAMAMLYQLEGEPELAEEKFKQTLRMNKNHTRARNNYGVFLFERERYQEAYEQFELAANDLDYDNRAQAMMSLGRTALRLGKTEKALSTFESANRLNPGLPRLKYELAELYFTLEDYASARR